MNDCQLDIQNKLKSEIQSNIKGRSTQIVQILHNGNAIVKYGDSYKYSPNRETAFRIAQQKVANLNNLYQSDQYGRVASIDNTFSDGIVINIHIPLALINSRIIDNLTRKNQNTPSIYLQDNEQYFVNGEVYPTYEDAQNALLNDYASLAKSSTIISENTLSQLRVIPSITEEQLETINSYLIKYDHPILMFRKGDTYFSSFEVGSDLVLIEKPNFQITSGNIDSVENVLITPGDIIVKDNNLVIKIGTITNNADIIISSEVLEEDYSSDTLYAKLIDYSKKINPSFKVQILDDLVRTTGAIGLAQLNDFVIKIQKGYEVSELPEEIAHFYFELLPESSDLKKQMYSQITSFQIYKNTLAQYRNSDLYKKNGKVDISKIKNEAIGKLISEYIKAQHYQDFTNINLATTSTGNFLQQWWNKFINWIRGNSVKSFQQSAENILMGSIEDLDLNTISNQTFASLAFENIETFTNELSTLDQNIIIRNIRNFHKLLSNHFRDIITKEKFRSLEAVLTDPKTGISKLDNALILIRNAQSNLELSENARTSIISFLNALTGMETLSKGINTRLDNLDPNTSNIVEVSNYANVTQSWLEYLQDLKISLATNPLPSNELEKLIDSLIGNFSTARAKITSQFGKDLSDFYLNWLNTKTQTQRNSLQRELDLANKNNNLVLVKKLQNQIDNITFTKEDIERALRGEIKLNGFDEMRFWMDAAVANGDPVIAATSNLVKEAGYKAEVNTEERVSSYEEDIKSEKDELAKNYKMDITDIGKAISFLDEVASWDNGELVKKKRYSFLSPFANYRYEIQKIKNDLSNAREEALQTQDWNKYKEIKLKFDKEIEDYFNRPYVKEYYELTKKYEENPLFLEGQAIRKELYNQKNNLQQQIIHGTVTDTTEKEIEQIEYQIRKLSSLVDLNGYDKTGKDLEIAKVLKAYSEDRRKYTEIDLLQSNRAFKKAEQLKLISLETIGLNETSDEFKKWTYDNTMMKILPIFYETRQSIIDQIDTIISKLNKEDQTKPLWDEIFKILDSARDQNGQYNTELLTEEQHSRVKKIQLEIEEIKKSIKNNAGLTLAQQKSYSNIQSKITELYNIKKKRALTEEEKEERKHLFERAQYYKDLMAQNGLTKREKITLQKLYDSLRKIQSRKPTDYYWDQIEYFVENLKEGYEDFNFNQILADKDYTSIEQFIQSDAAFNLRKENLEFNKWFERTHFEQEYFDIKLKSYSVKWSRHHQWNIIEPTNPNHFEIVPSYKYTKFKVKDEYRTPMIVGKTIDNRGEFLPLTMKEGALTDKYQNTKYTELSNSTDNKSKLLKSYLDKTINHFLNAQEELQYADKFYLDLPRMQVSNLEKQRKKLTKSYYTQNLQERLKAEESFLGKMGAVIGLKYTKEEDEVEGRGSIVNIDANTNETLSRGFDDVVFGMKRDIAPVNQTLDLGILMSNFFYAVEENVAKKDIFPIISATKNFLSEMSQKTERKTGKKEKRSDIIDRMIDKHFKGKIPDVLMNHPALRKFVNGLKMIGAWKLLIDPIGGVVNYGTAFIQTMVEGVSGQNYNLKDYLWAEKTFHKEIMKDLLKDYSKLGHKGFWTTLYETFDFVQGEWKNELGERFSFKNKTFNLSKVLMMPRTLGELKIQTISSIMMLKNTKLLNNKDNKTYSYLDALDFKEGKIKMKEGFDSSYAPGGQKFLDLKSKIHGINKQLHGNYASRDQSEISRYTFGQMFEFMKRFLVSTTLKRYQGNKFNYSTQQYEEGFYRTGFKTYGKLVSLPVFYFVEKYGNLSRKDFLFSWNNMTTQEKQNFKRFTAEITILLSIYALATFGLGYSGDDKNKELAKNSLATNYFLYTLLKVQSENTQYIPYPGLGLDDFTRNINGLQMFTGVISDALTVSKLFQYHIRDMAGEEGLDNELYFSKDQKTFLRHSGDSKIRLKLLQLMGYSGKNIDPAFAIKQLEAAQRRVR